jgi:hypothetical protein
VTHFDAFIEAYSRLPVEERTLGGDFIICPPEVGFAYPSTPLNAVIFSEMRVDGVHDAILKIDGEVSDSSPVVQVSPMDSDDVFIVAESLLDYLAVGCAASLAEIKSLFELEHSGSQALVPFVSERFDGIRLLDEERLKRLAEAQQHIIRRKTQA